MLLTLFSTVSAVKTDVKSFVAPPLIGKVLVTHFLTEEHRLREQKKQEHLLRMSGIKRVKLLTDFDWTFNQKIPREKLMEFMATDWLQKQFNLILVGPSRVGKTHVATASATMR